MKLKAFERGPVDTFGYVLHDDSSGQALLVDVPPDSAADIISWLDSRELKLERIVLTQATRPCWNILPRASPDCRFASRG